MKFLAISYLDICPAGRKGPQPFDGPGQVKQSGIGSYSALPALHQLRRDCRAEHPLVARPMSWALFSCAKDLFVAANDGWDSPNRD